MNLSTNNMSVLYLSLGCVLYYLLVSGALSPAPKEFHTDSTVYIEIDQEEHSTIHALNNQRDQDYIDIIYGIDTNNGTRVILDHDNNAAIGRISGIKSISLGIPIGINSATENDLAALPGIGTTLAGRIIRYRESMGGFKNLSELDNVQGVGVITLKSLEGKISLH